MGTLTWVSTNIKIEKGQIVIIYTRIGKCYILERIKYKRLRTQISFKNWLCSKA